MAGRAIELRDDDTCRLSIGRSARFAVLLDFTREKFLKKYVDVCRPLV